MDEEASRCMRSLEAARRRSPAGSTRVEREAASRRRVVVVDRCPDTRESLALLLRAAGMDVRDFDSVASARADLHAFEPDALLLELDRAALDLARGLRSDPRLRRAFLVAVTAWSLARVEADALAAGFDACLLKGCDPDALVAVACGGKRLEPAPGPSPASAPAPAEGGSPDGRAPDASG